eukprot:TRINITY_DN10267_c0_g1_i1.p1 TRINITY_DN10267_c0_g1~~TRINITY_DN10267_c0_g1_i1.p1  ORF type:complete len:614 (+),score=144.73 TRINITY_DN10267_c0_g1_i1:425-2266(+)
MDPVVSKDEAAATAEQLSSFFQTVIEHERPKDRCRHQTACKCDPSRIVKAKQEVPQILPFDLKAPKIDASTFSAPSSRAFFTAPQRAAFTFGASPTAASNPPAAPPADPTARNSQISWFSAPSAAIPTVVQEDPMDTLQTVSAGPSVDPSDLDKAGSVLAGLFRMDPALAARFVAQTAVSALPQATVTVNIDVQAWFQPVQTFTATSTTPPAFGARAPLAMFGTGASIAPSVASAAVTTATTTTAAAAANPFAGSTFNARTFATLSGSGSNAITPAPAKAPTGFQFATPTAASATTTPFSVPQSQLPLSTPLPPPSVQPSAQPMFGTAHHVPFFGTMLPPLAANSSTLSTDMHTASGTAADASSAAAALGGVIPALSAAHQTRSAQPSSGGDVSSYEEMFSYRSSVHDVTPRAGVSAPYGIIAAQQQQVPVGDMLSRPFAFAPQQIRTVSVDEHLQPAEKLSAEQQQRKAMEQAMEQVTAMDQAFGMPSGGEGLDLPARIAKCTQLLASLTRPPRLQKLFDEDFPDDCVTAIADWLPVKDVLRLRLVCASWAKVIHTDDVLWHKLMVRDFKWLREQVPTGCKTWWGAYVFVHHWQRTYQGVDSMRLLKKGREY